MSTTTTTDPSRPLDSKEISRVALILRCLLGISEPEVALRAARLGYTKEEHAQGWRLIEAASGASVTFDELLAEADRRLSAPEASRLRAILGELDVFENKWYPLAGTAIARFVPPERREVVRQAFFSDMSQQPLGPGVVGSCEKLLGRAAGLRTSSEPGAAAAYEALVQKGLTPPLTKHIAALIAEAKTFVVAPPAVDEEARAAAHAKLFAERRAAYEQLNLWYMDWAQLFRGELTYNQLLRLGLIRRPGVRAEEAEEPEPAVAATPGSGTTAATPR